MRKPLLRCGMCLRQLTITRPHRGRMPTYCPECRDRRKTEQSRLAMARMRAQRRHA